MDAVEVLVDEQTKPFYLSSPERPLAPPLVAMEGASAGYGERIILKRLNLSFGPDERIALLGPNGNGKSTFCKLIAGRIPTLAGEVKRSSKLNVAFFAQHQLDDLKPEQSAADHVRAQMPDIGEAKIRAAAARIGFSGLRADVAVKKLSGGEKARLTLGLIGLTAPHLLILDEPTNHLDIDSRGALVEAINDYEGAVIIVSHDRFLIEACADTLWLVADNTVQVYDGDLDDYRRKVLSGDSGSATKKQPKQQNQPQDKASLPPMTAQKPLAAPDPALLREARKRREAAEARMAKFSGLIARIDKAIGDGQVFQREPERARQYARQRAELAVALNAAEEEWLELSEV